MLSALLSALLIFEMAAAPLPQVTIVHPPTSISLNQATNTAIASLIVPLDSPLRIDSDFMSKVGAYTVPALKAAFEALGYVPPQGGNKAQLKKLLNSIYAMKATLVGVSQGHLSIIAASFSPPPLVSSIHVLRAVSHYTRAHALGELHYPHRIHHRRRSSGV